MCCLESELNPVSELDSGLDSVTRDRLVLHCQFKYFVAVLLLKEKLLLVYKHAIYNRHTLDNL